MCRCWCGNAHTNVAKHGQLNNVWCNQPCPGNSNEMCGGPWIFNAFKIRHSGHHSGHRALDGEYEHEVEDEDYENENEIENEEDA